MQITFTHGDKASVPWNKGDLVTVKITKVTGDTYTAETVETYPADIKERHNAQLAQEQKRYKEMADVTTKQLEERHRGEVEGLRADHAAEKAALTEHIGSVTEQLRQANDDGKATTD